MPERQRKALDWEAVHARLARSARTGERTPAECEKILERRAEALAERPAAGAERTGAGEQALLFALAGAQFALDPARIAEVAPLHNLTAVPKAPPGLLGVVNLRGEVRCVLDLRPALGLDPGDSVPTDGYALMLRDGDGPGLYVDAVERIGTILCSRLSPAGDSRLVRGLTPERIQVLDLEAALDYVLERGPAAARAEKRRKQMP